jgi:hypothetical protein
MPVLNSVVELLGHSYMVTVSDIAARTGLELAEVARSLDAMDPTFVDFRKTETGGDPTFWYVNRVTPEARRAVGQWPTPEGLVDRLVQAFNNAADHEEDAERHYQLRQAAGLLGETVRDVAVKVAATITGPSAANVAADPGGPSAVGSPSVADGPSAVGGPSVGDGPSAVGGPSVGDGPSAVGGPSVADGPSAVDGA